MRARVGVLEDVRRAAGGDAEGNLKIVVHHSSLP